MWNTDSISYQTDENWVWNLIKNELYETRNNVSFTIFKIVYNR